ncbi:glycerophosphodiester phosphodiesterase [Belliella sp. R4-6]|uniref:Glycerophosphodiester phosphodiesterase n=1 Tax=Belliella alkalica TaxID=1730871 RepID=A0ABS9VF74_9BACT|nr:glycerophosphodiester phosphodiesterase family protein [Belliella alkalica]MCH7415106.1 glycerophosphodiester phosphodiesterase [Belliella alkalica]
MKKSLLFALIFIPMISKAQFSYDLQGHRGSRGLMPENTIPAMIKALDLGVTTLELDLAVTKDGEIIVSHEPYMNPLICFTPEGSEIKDGDKSHNIYQMTFEEVKKYDSGTKFHAGFPQQVKFHVTKPRLKDLFEVVEKYVADHNLPSPYYNIEIKSSVEGDGAYHPAPAEFSDMVYKLIDSSVSWERVNIQSFDFRVLKYYNQTYPDVTLAMLITDATKSKAQLEELGFQPQIYSPYFVALNQETVKELKEKGMKIIPWTVNTTEQMQKLLDMGVDGIITDFPNLAPKQ